MPIARARNRGTSSALLPVPIENAVERFAARVGENKNGPSFVARERQRFGRPCGLKFGRERVFVLKASQTLEQRLFCSRSHYQKWDSLPRCRAR